MPCVEYSPRFQCQRRNSDINGSIQWVWFVCSSSCCCFTWYYSDQREWPDDEASCKIHSACILVLEDSKPIYPQSTLQRVDFALLLQHGMSSNQAHPHIQTIRWNIRGLTCCKQENYSRTIEKKNFRHSLSPIIPARTITILKVMKAMGISNNDCSPNYSCNKWAWNWKDNRHVQKGWRGNSDFYITFKEVHNGNL